MTKNRSYREIQRLWNDCVFYYLQNGKINYKVMQEISSDFGDTNKLNMFG
jgi:hypothetical protein